jgi:AraC family transcriptional regulator
MPTVRELLQVLHDVSRRADRDVSLRALALRSGWSPFHLQRAFRRAIGETPKQYSLRLRLERAAASLAGTDAGVLDVAFAAGFCSHEVFLRAFRRHFGCTPSRYRRVALQNATREVRTSHLSLIHGIGPCIGAFHIQTGTRRSKMPTTSITRQEIAEQPTVYVRKRAGRHELATAIGDALGKAFPYAMQSGAGVAGRPFARYVEMGAGLMTVEIGVPVSHAVAGAGEIEAGSLPGGAVAVGIHMGSYEQLHETFANIERWIETEGYQKGGAPWESYITDPAELPDPAEWRTDVYWPLIAATGSRE